MPKNAPAACTFHASRHPLVIHKLSYLRQPRPYVSSRDYASLMRELGMLMAVEACATLRLEDRTSDESGIVKRFPRYFPKPRHVLPHASRPVIISVVRSGLVMAEGVREIVPTPYMGHIGVVIAPDQALPFIVTLPESTPGRVCLVVDPFVTSGTTAIAVLRLLIANGINAPNIRFLTLCMARAGHARLRNEMSIAGVQFFCGRIDGQGEIAPKEDWIKDFGDMNERLFRTINRDEAEFITTSDDSVESDRNARN